MLKITKIIEKIIISAIMIVFSVILVLAFIDVIYEIYDDIITPPLFVVNSANLMELFSLFLIIIIGIELLETIKAYLIENVIHVELVILVAIIAIARKVIVWDFNKYSHYELLALALMMLTLGTTYYLIKKVSVDRKLKQNEGKEK